MAINFGILRRIQYFKVIHLIDAVNNAISLIIFAAFTNNLISVCVQFARSLRYKLIKFT